MTVRERKRVLRVASAARRAKAQAAAGPGAAARLRANFEARVQVPVGACVSGYWPVGSEMDPRELLAALADRGHPLALPVVQGRGRPLLFRAWRPGAEMEPGTLSIPVPPPSAPELRPRVLLVPLLAFDRAGYRLGHGAGYYDLTLAGLRAAGPVLAVGVAYAAQQVPTVPCEPHDARLDLIVTEAGAVVPA